MKFWDNWNCTQRVTVWDLWALENLTIYIWTIDLSQLIFVILNLLIMPISLLNNFLNWYFIIIALWKLFFKILFLIFCFFSILILILSLLFFFKLLNFLTLLTFVFLFSVFQLMLILDLLFLFYLLQSLCVDYFMRNKVFFKLVYQRLFICIPLIFILLIWLIFTLKYEIK